MRSRKTISAQRASRLNALDWPLLDKHQFSLHTTLSILSFTKSSRRRVSIRHIRSFGNRRRPGSNFKSLQSPVAGPRTHYASSGNNSSWHSDDWPKMPDGIDFDGKQLLTLVRRGNSPFHGVWDVNQLIREVEQNLCTKVIDMTFRSSTGDLITT